MRGLAALLLGMLLPALVACGEAPSARPDASPGPDAPVPAGLVGAWQADGAAVEATVLRFMLARTYLESLPSSERAPTRPDLTRQAHEFAAACPLELALHDDSTFAYKRKQPPSPTYLRAVHFRAGGTRLHLQVDAMRTDDGRPVQEARKAEWLRHEVRWEGRRLRSEAPGRETFEFLLYRPYPGVGGVTPGPSGGRGRASGCRNGHNADARRGNRVSDRALRWRVARTRAHRDPC